MDSLKLLRERRLMTQEDLAEAAGVGIATISRFETGKVKPSLRTIRALAKPLRISAEELYDLVTSQQQRLL
jgi:transcriptional regulator with XRE-family HTH domain